MIIGLETETVSPPHDPEATFVLRLALPVSVAERARSIAGFTALANLSTAAGSSQVQSLLDALKSGASAEDVADEVNAAMGEETPENTDDMREQYDMDYLTYRLIQSWPYRKSGDYTTGKKIPVKLKYVRMLDAETRTWLHDKAWEAMRMYLPKEQLEGNS